MIYKLGGFFTPTKLYLLCFLVVLSSCSKETISKDEGTTFTYSPKEIAPGVLLGEVYKTNNFASFTDITYFNHAWYVIFRAGTEHMGGLNGQIKIVKSTDAVKWTVQYVLANDTLDLRDPKFVIDSINNRLYLNYTGVKYMASGSYATKGSRVYGFMSDYNTASQKWNEPQLITNDNTTGEQFV